MITVARKLVVLILFCLPLAALAQQAPFKEGVHYERISKKADPVDPANAKEVVEMFSYRCPHCFSFEKTVDSWLETKPDDVTFIRVPVGFGRKSWELMARAYYIAEEVDQVAALHGSLMDAIHVKQLEIADVDELAELFAANGVDRTAFDKANKTFSVETKTRRAKQLVKRYRVPSVPNLIVNGLYRVTGGSTREEMMQIVDYLLTLDKDAS